jgi:hypothetical protein
MIRVDGYKNLYRDDSGAIVNIDTDEYSQYVKLRSQRKQQKDELVEMKKDIDEIKSLLKEFLNGPRQN